MIIIIALDIWQNKIKARKLLNPFKLYEIFGLPGSGKSLIGTAIAWKHSPLGLKMRIINKLRSFLHLKPIKWTIYTNISGINWGDVRPLDVAKFKAGKWLPDGRKGYPEWYGYEYDKEKKEYVYIHSDKINQEDRRNVIIGDEWGIWYNNRNFKNNFPGDFTLQWLKEHRKMKCKIYIISQSYEDMDLKWRQLADQLLIVKRSKILKTFTISRPIAIEMGPVTTTEGDSAGGKIVTSYSYAPFLTWRAYYMPKWIKKYDSFKSAYIDRKDQAKP